MVIQKWEMARKHRYVRSLIQKKYGMHSQIGCMHPVFLFQIIFFRLSPIQVVVNG